MRAVPIVVYGYCADVLTLFHDYTSPASAVAALRLQRLADEGLPVSFVGFDVVGLDAVLPVPVDLIAALDELSTLAGVEGLKLRRPPAMSPTALAHVVGMLAEEADLGASWRTRCYRAFWEEGAAIGEASVLHGLGVEAGLDPEALHTALADRQRLQRVRRRAAEHRRQGVGGVPALLAHGTLVPALVPEDELRTLGRL